MATYKCIFESFGFAPGLVRETFGVSFHFGFRHSTHELFRFSDLSDLSSLVDPFVPFFRKIQIYFSRHLLRVNLYYASHALKFIIHYIYYTHLRIRRIKRNPNVTEVYTRYKKVLIKILCISACCVHSLHFP